MSLKESLKDFAGSIAVATTDPPDNYAEWSSWSYETHMTDLRELWAQIRPQVKRDLNQAEFIDAKLMELFKAFDAGKTDVGRNAAWAIYNLKLKDLR